MYVFNDLCCTCACLSTRALCCTCACLSTRVLCCTWTCLPPRVQCMLYLEKHSLQIFFFCFGFFETSLFVSVVSIRVRNIETNRKRNFLVSRNKPKNNRNRLCFGSFRFKPKIFFVCFEDTLIASYHWTDEYYYYKFIVYTKLLDSPKWQFREQIRQTPQAHTLPPPPEDTRLKML